MQKKMNVKFQNTLLHTAEDFVPVLPENADFWRVFLDYCQPGKNRELAVYAHEQPAPTVSETENTLKITYLQLVAEDGSVHNIRLTLVISVDAAGTLHYSAEMENRSAVRSMSCSTRSFLSAGCTAI